MAEASASPEPLGIALVGVGRWGRRWLTTLERNSNVELRWLCDPLLREPQLLDRQLLERQGSLDPLETSGRWATRLSTALEDDDVQAVVIATPSSTHAHLALQALERGRHVLVEKPITTDALGLERLLAAAKRVERTVMVNHLLLYHPAFTALQAALAEGLIGDVRAISAHRFSPPRDRDECPWWSLAPHDLALIDRIAPELLSGSVKVENRPSEVRVRLESTAIRALLRVGHCGSRKVRLFVVQGSRGALVFDDADGEKLTLHPHVRPGDERSSEDELTLRKRLGPGHPLRCGEELPLDLSLRHFVEAIAESREPLSGAEHAQRILAALLRVKAFQGPKNQAAALEIVA